MLAVLGVLLSLFVLAEVNYPNLAPQSQLAIFALLGLLLIWIKVPVSVRLSPTFRWVIDGTLLAATLISFCYVVLQTEPVFARWWIGGEPLGNRAGIEGSIDIAMGLVGLLLIIEATRRTIGQTLPLLALLFIAYAAFGPAMPDWLFPHRGYSWDRIVSQTFLHSQGVFGIALKVMFTYVFLFVLFGTLLEGTGATAFIIRLARRVFRNSPGGPAKVAVLSSGLMGSLSGSAVANTATTGTFTIPLMRSTGFQPAVAGGIEAAASSGGALVPPIMGAGAYMMLEIIDPPVTYLDIIGAAILPALLYYLSLLLIVHFYARRIGAGHEEEAPSPPPAAQAAPGLVFAAAFAVLILLLVLGFTPFRAVSVSLLAILLSAAFSAQTRLNLPKIVDAMSRAAQSGVSLIAAAGCVGIIIGVVTLTGIGSRLPSVILPLAENHLVLGLILLMISTIILGMGLPSAVCYLLMATLIGPVLGDLGLVPLAAHLFIFYFGMMSMVTPPVALAAYTASAIANAGVMETAVKAFRFSLVGFALPYAFTLRPELLLLGEQGTLVHALPALFFTVTGIVALSASLGGFLFTPLNRYWRIAFLACGILLILWQQFPVQLVLAGAVLGLSLFNNREGRRTGPTG
ncbi:MAG: TRAP transporter fused permease subunit [Calditrichaeota bacterium]|nr:TRAP transporter fused permease subunit [Calditrichota bacterium]